jgi:hypothetical protein
MVEPICLRNLNGVNESVAQTSCRTGQKRLSRLESKSMAAQIYLMLALIVVLMTVGRVIWRPLPKNVDWALEVAFIRLDFPPEQREVAQQLAAGLAEIVGTKIKQLKPEHNLSQIAEWAENGIYAKDLITLFVVAFSVKCDVDTTFRDLVEKVACKKTEFCTSKAAASA